MTRTVMVLTAVAAFTAGVGWYIIRVARPARVKRQAQDEIAGWEDRLKAARNCLLGPNPGSSKTSEALALRELSGDASEPGCTRLVGELSRGIAPDSGLPDVETAWTTHVAGDTVTNEPAISISSTISAVDTDGRALVAWTDSPPKASHARIFKMGASEPAIDLDSAPVSGCLSADRAWLVVASHAVYAFGGTKPPNHSIAVGELQGCTTDGALFRGTSGDRHNNEKSDTFAVCTDACRPAKLPPGAPNLVVVTMVGGKLVAIASHSAVLGVWREGAPPTFYSIPAVAGDDDERWQPEIAFSDGKVIDVIMSRAGGYNDIVRIPATGGS